MVSVQNGCIQEIINQVILQRMQFQQDPHQKHKSPSQLLNLELEKSYALIDLRAIQQVKNLLSYVEDKTYKLYIQQPITYFQYVWEHITENNKQYQQIIIPLMDERYHNVFDDLLNNKLKIQQRPPLLPYDFQGDYKNTKINQLKQQSNQIKKKIQDINKSLYQIKDNQKINDGIQQNSQNNQERRKEYEQKIKKIKQEKQERHKKLNQLKKKQQEELRKKQAQIKQQQEKIMKQKRQQSFRKQQQHHQLRQKDKLLRAQRNTQYIRLKKVIDQKPPLFQRLELDYNKRYLQIQAQQRQRLLNERKSLFQHIDQMKLQEHQKFYEKVRQERQHQRKEKLLKMSQEQKQRMKFHSSYQLRKQPDLKQEQRNQAREKIQKIKQYKELVKQKYKPRVDESKKKQLMNLIEQMELGRKKVKKTKLQNGSIVYEEVKLSDPRMLGMEYLQQVKEMAAKMKLQGKRKNSVDLNPIQQKKKINYLEQLRSQTKPRKIKTNFSDVNMSYQQKVKKVELQTERLKQLTRQKEMKLKFGKFKTSEQILACKQQIDQHYLQIVKMKLLLINPDNNNNNIR